MLRNKRLAGRSGGFLRLRITIASPIYQQINSLRCHNNYNAVLQVQCAIGGSSPRCQGPDEKLLENFNHS